MDSTIQPAARQRTRLLIALVGVTLVVTGAVVWVVVGSAHTEVRHATRTSIAAAVDQTEAHLEGFFGPINELLVMTAAWGENGELALGDEPALSAHFVPVLERTPVSSLMVADEQGSEYMLLQTAAGFRSRVTRPAEWPGLARWKRWRDSRATVEAWEEQLDYDARVRPWYRQARKAGGARLAFTQPYTFFTTKEPGVTGSRQFRYQGADYVVGFDILLNDISKLTAGIELTPNGRVVVLSEDGRIIGLPRDPRFTGDGMVQSVLKRPEEVGLPEIAAALAAAGAASSDHFRFESGGEAWWAGLRPVDISGQRFSIVVAVPERDVVGNAASKRNQVVLLLVLGLVVAGTLLYLFQRLVHRDLAHAAAKLDRVGQYTLEHQIGAGGMGTVYRARHALLRRPTAIKLLDTSRSRDPKAVARFKREVELTSTLTHPNTIAIYDFGFTTDGVFYYAMEYLRGADLRAIVTADGPQPAERVAHILVQVCGSLTEAHAAGLTHRDIKPGNVILSERGGVYDVAKVLDFGLVKQSDAAHSEANPRLTRDDSISGTPDYLSPEAIKRPTEVGPPADLYAVGALGYYLLTGSPPFTGKTFVEICIKHTREPPPPLPDAVPDSLAELLTACLAKEPSARPTAAELADRLSASGLADGWTQQLAAQWWRAHDELLGRDDGRTTSPKTIQIDAPSG
jgi:hypothetical protein